MTQEIDQKTIEFYKEIFSVLSEDWNPGEYPKGDERNNKYLLYVSHLCHLALSGEGESSLVESMQQTSSKMFGKEIAHGKLIPIAKSIIDICDKK